MKTEKRKREKRTGKDYVVVLCETLGVLEEQQPSRDDKKKMEPGVVSLQH